MFFIYNYNLENQCKNIHKADFWRKIFTHKNNIILDN